MIAWLDAKSSPPTIDLGDSVEVWVCIRDRKGALKTSVAYYVNHPLADIGPDDEYPDWVSLNHDGEPADFVGFARLTSHPDYDGYYEPITGVEQWAEIEYPEPPVLIGEQHEQRFRQHQLRGAIQE